MYYASVTLHVLAALLWLGGMFFLVVVGAPVLRQVEPPALRAELFRRLGVQFRLIGWIAVAVLLATGLANLQFRGLLHGSALGEPAFWGSAYGRALGVKLGAVTAMVLLSALHDFILGPAASRVEAGTPRALALRRWSAWVARVNAILGVVLVIAAVRLASP